MQSLGQEANCALHVVLTLGNLCHCIAKVYKFVCDSRSCSTCQAVVSSCLPSRYDHGDSTAILQTRLNMELAALGTPEMSVAKVRVPRQAATAAKAAIKKDLLQQKSRPGAASVPSKPSSLTAAKASVPTTKSVGLNPKKKQQPKVTSKYRDKLPCRLAVCLSACLRVIVCASDPALPKSSLQGADAKGTVVSLQTALASHAGC